MRIRNNKKSVPRHFGKTLKCLTTTILELIFEYSTMFRENPFMFKFSSAAGTASSACFSSMAPIRGVGDDMSLARGHRAQ